MNEIAKYIAILALSLGNVCVLANDWLQVSYASLKPDNNNLDMSDGYTVAGQMDFDLFYLRGYYTSGEIESWLGFTDWDIWNAEHVSFEKGHIFDKQATIELGTVFNSGLVLAITADAIHAKQMSRRYNDVGLHMGYDYNEWKTGSGFLIGFQSGWDNVRYRIDIGTTDHIVSDYRLQGELEYKLNNFNVLVNIKDHADLDFTQHEIGVRYEF